MAAGDSARVRAPDRVSPNWTRFQNGEFLGYDPASPWHVSVREKTRAGKVFARVRLVDSPPTEGQRFLLASGIGNVEAGEDIRNLYRVDAERLGTALTSTSGSSTPGSSLGSTSTTRE